MTYQDTVQLATTTTDGYGDKTVIVLTDSKALFIQRTSIEHSNNADGIASDAAVYLDPTNAVVTANVNRLEGMYIVASAFGESYGDGEYSSLPYSEKKNWYRITHVTVGQRKLLNNVIDNVYCLLEKEAGVPYVTYVS